MTEKVKQQLSSGGENTFLGLLSYDQQYISLLNGAKECTINGENKEMILGIIKSMCMFSLNGYVSCRFYYAIDNSAS